MQRTSGPGPMFPWFVKWLKAGDSRLVAGFLALLLGGMAGAPPAHATEGGPPRVVVSIKPLHALVAGVMDGVAPPTLLMSGGGSPHAYTLRPSEARALQAAQVVFWGGPALEGFLGRPLRSLTDRARVVPLLEAPGLRLLAARRGGPWADDDDHGHSHDAKAGHGDGKGEPVNPHVWLDPRNATAIARYVAAVLAATDPARGGDYTANAERLVRRLTNLDAELAAALAPYRSRPFLVFHDAYPYLEARYGLDAAGAITVSPDRPPGARRVRELRETIRQRGAVCVFAEPQFEPRLVRTLVEGTGARIGVLDPLGSSLPAGPDLYEALMHGLAADFVACMGG